MVYHYTKFLRKYEQQCLPAINYIAENNIELPVLAGSNLNVKDLVKYHSAFMTFAKKHPTLDENQVIFDLFFKGLGPKFWEALEENYFKNTLNMQNIIAQCTSALKQNPYLLIYMEWPIYCFQRYYDKFIMCQHKCKTTQMDIPVKSFIDGIDRNRPYRNPKLVKALTDVYQNGTLTMENAVEKCREIIDEDPCILQYYSFQDTLQSYTERFLQHQRKSGKSMNEICRSYIDGFQPAEEMLHARLVKKFPSGTNIASLNIIEKSILGIIRNEKDLFELCQFDTENFSISKCQSETTTTKPTVALDCFHGSRCLACDAKGDIQSLSEYYDINETELNEKVLNALQCSKNVSTGDAKGANTNAKSSFMKACLKKESEAKSMQEISGNAKKKRKRVKELQSRAHF